MTTTVSYTLTEEAVYAALRQFCGAPEGAHVRIYSGVETDYPDGATVTWDLPSAATEEAAMTPHQRATFDAVMQQRDRLKPNADGTIPIRKDVENG